MSPLILALFSASGVDRVWHERGRLCIGAHRCPPRCGRQQGRCCAWEALQERSR